MHGKNQGGLLLHPGQGARGKQDHACKKQEAVAKEGEGPLPPERIMGIAHTVHSQAFSSFKKQVDVAMRDMGGSFQFSLAQVKAFLD